MCNSGRDTRTDNPRALFQSCVQSVLELLWQSVGILDDAKEKEKEKRSRLASIDGGVDGVDGGKATDSPLILPATDDSTANNSNISVNAKKVQSGDDEQLVRQTVRLQIEIFEVLSALQRSGIAWNCTSGESRDFSPCLVTSCQRCHVVLSFRIISIPSPSLPFTSIETALTRYTIELCPIWSNLAEEHINTHSNQLPHDDLSMPWTLTASPYNTCIHPLTESQRREVTAAEVLFCRVLGRFFKSRESSEKARILDLGFLPFPPSNSKLFSEIAVQMKSSQFDGHIREALPSLMPAVDFSVKRERVRSSVEAALLSVNAIPPNTRVALYGSSMNNFGNDDAGECSKWSRSVIWYDVMWCDMTRYDIRFDPMISYYVSYYVMWYNLIWHEI